MTAALAASSLDGPYTRASVSKYWTTLLLAVQTIAARLNLPLASFDVSCGSATCILLKAGSNHQDFAVIQVLTDAEFEERMQDLRSGDGRDVASDISKGDIAFPSAPVNELKLMDNVRPLCFPFTICLLSGHFLSLICSQWPCPSLMERIL
jgi:hypothetical protein